jgi:hypothetical protein
MNFNVKSFICFKLVILAIKNLIKLIFIFHKSKINFHYPPIKNKIVLNFYTNLLIFHLYLSIDATINILNHVVLSLLLFHHPI